MSDELSVKLDFKAANSVFNKNLYFIRDTPRKKKIEEETPNSIFRCSHSHSHFHFEIGNTAKSLSSA